MSNNLIGFLIDMSGSMDERSGGAPAKEAANLFMHYQKTRVDDCQLVFSTFCDTYTKVYQGSIFDMPEIDGSIYHPQGGTALWQAIGMMYEDMQKAVEKYNPAHVTWLIHTDGGEVWYGAGEHALATLNQARDKGWEVVWLAEMKNTEAMMSAWNLEFPDDHIIAYPSSNSAGFEIAAIQVLESVVTNSINTTNAQSMLNAKLPPPDEKRLETLVKAAKEVYSKVRKTHAVKAKV